MFDFVGEILSRMEKPYTNARVVGDPIFSLGECLVCIGSFWFVGGVW